MQIYVTKSGGRIVENVRNNPTKKYQKTMRFERDTFKIIFNIDYCIYSLQRILFGRTYICYVTLYTFI